MHPIILTSGVTEDNPSRKILDNFIPH